MAPVRYVAVRIAAFPSPHCFTFGRVDAERLSNLRREIVLTDAVCGDA